MQLSFRLEKPPKKIEADITCLIAGMISREWNRALPPFAVEFRRLLKHGLESQPEYSSLTDTNGVLLGEFGLVPGEAKQRIDTIVERWLDSITVSLKPLRVSGSGIVGGFTVSAIRTNMLDVLSLTEASYDTDKGENIPFLRFLLLSGDKPLIRNWRYLHNAGLNVGRSGQGVMIPKKGGLWQVPAQFSGTASDNLTHKAIRSIGPDLERLIERSFIL